MGDIVRNDLVNQNTADLWSYLVSYRKNKSVWSIIQNHAVRGDLPEFVEIVIGLMAAHCQISKVVVRESLSDVDWDHMMVEARGNSD